MFQINSFVMKVQLSNFGSSLSSRLKGRQVFDAIKSDVANTKCIVLDFQDVKLMTLSFGTELIDSIKNNSNADLEIINTSDHLASILGFCLRNVKEVTA